VVHSNFDDFYHPIVSVLSDANREAYTPPSIVDLHTQKDIKVASVIEEDLGVEGDLGFV
jgi:hypothetical protein